ncbi:RNA polymerase sigma factor region1.1 domain-containing protein, partial [Roseomonas sp. GCM10028921]
MVAMDADGGLVLDEREEALLSSLPEAEGQALRRLAELARIRGHVTHAEISVALPSDQLTSDRIEDALAVLSAMGVEVAEDHGAEAEDGDTPEGAP